MCVRDVTDFMEIYAVETFIKENIDVPVKIAYFELQLAMAAVRYVVKFLLELVNVITLFNLIWSIKRSIWYVVEAFGIFSLFFTGNFALRMVFRIGGWSR